MNLRPVSLSLTLLMASAIPACSKPQSPGASGDGAAEGARPAASDQAPVELRPAEGAILHEYGGELWQLAFELRVPSALRPDEGFGPRGWIASASEQGPDIQVSANTCWPGVCDPANWKQPEAEAEGIRVVRKDLLDPRRGLLVTRRSGDDMVIVDHLPAGPPEILLRCQAWAPTGSALFDALVESCSGLRPRPMERWLSGARLAEQQKKLADCPSSSSVRLTVRDEAAVSFQARPFGEVAKSLALQEEVGKLVIRLSNSAAEDALGERRPGDTSLRLDIELKDLRQARLELTSGSYRKEGEDWWLSAELLGASTLDEEAKAILGDKSPVGDEGTSSVEIIARTLDRVCGRFSFREEGGEVSGEFDVTLEVRPTPND